MFSNISEEEIKSIFGDEKPAKHERACANIYGIEWINKISKIYNMTPKQWIKRRAWLMQLDI